MPRKDGLRFPGGAAEIGNRKLLVFPLGGGKGASGPVPRDVVSIDFAKMDNDFDIDLVDIAASLASAEVATLRFVAVGHRLILDFRTSDIDGPMVKVVEPVKSVEERYRTLARWRPRFAAPEKITSVWWPRFAASLRTAAVWEKVMERISDSGHPDAVRRAEAALDELIALEAEQQKNAIVGTGFRTLWSASPTPR